MSGENELPPEVHASLRRLMQEVWDAAAARGNAGQRERWVTYGCERAARLILTERARHEAGEARG